MFAGFDVCAGVGSRCWMLLQVLEVVADVGVFMCLCWWWLQLVFVDDGVCRWLWSIQVLVVACGGVGR